MSVTANQQALRNERGCFERKVPSDAGVTTDMITSTAKCAIDDSLYVRPTVQKPAGCIKLDPSPTDASYVRFGSKSGHVQCGRPCPLWARSGHYQSYSITS